MFYFYDLWKGQKIKGWVSPTIIIYARNTLISGSNLVTSDHQIKLIFSAALYTFSPPVFFQIGLDIYQFRSPKISMLVWNVCALNALFLYTPKWLRSSLFYIKLMYLICHILEKYNKIPSKMYKSKSVTKVKTKSAAKSAQ